MKLKILAVFMFSLMLIVCMVGCGNETGGSDNTYSAQLPYSAQEYTSFINKEITPVTNQLITQMMMVKNVANGEGQKNDALYSAKASLSVVQDCYNAVDIMQPATEYTDLRLEVLTNLQNIEATLETYIAELEKDTPDKSILDKVSADMETQYTALTALFGVYWQ